MNHTDLSLKVKALRKKIGLSQEMLAENSGLSLRTIQRVENGENEPTGNSLMKIANALKVSQDELLDWSVLEDKYFLMRMNLSALTFIFGGFLGALIPFILWNSNKNKIKMVDKLGRDLVNFQITWLLLAGFGSFLISMSLGFNMESATNISATDIKEMLTQILIYLTVISALNILLIIFNTFRITNGKKVMYFPKIRFLK